MHSVAVEGHGDGHGHAHGQGHGGAGATEDAATPATLTWTCSRCGGAGEAECGDPHASVVYPCDECRRSGKITSETITLEKALRISDVSALRFVLGKPQTQGDLDRALVWCEAKYAQLLVDAGADVQVSFQKYVHSKLHGRFYDLRHEHVHKLRVLVDNGATTGDEELALLSAAHEGCDAQYGWGQRAREVLAGISDVLASAQRKILNVYITETSCDSWAIAVHSVGGDLVATLGDISPSLTLGELQEELKSQASIPCGRQSLVLDHAKIEAHTSRSKPLREVLAR